MDPSRYRIKTRTIELGKEYKIRLKVCCDRIHRIYYAQQSFQHLERFDRSFQSAVMGGGLGICIPDCPPHWRKSRFKNCGIGTPSPTSSTARIHLHKLLPPESRSFGLALDAWMSKKLVLLLSDADADGQCWSDGWQRRHTVRLLSS